MRRLPLALGLVLICLQPACRKTEQSEAKSKEEAKSEQPGLFTVQPDQAARLKTTQVRAANWQVAVHTTGTVDWDADHTTQAITQVNGPITRILVDQGTPVKKDQPLLYVSSPDVANAVATYRKARNREAYNQRIVDRMKELLDRGAIAQKDFQSSEADYNDATTDVQNSLQALRIFGITSQDIDTAEKQGTPVPTELAVRSPISGVIVQKMVSPGQVVQAGQTVCFSISDVSTVWVQGHIFDRDLPSVKSGDPVDETNPSFGHNFRGTVSYIGTFVDPDTRTTPVRIVTSNPGGLLKKDMFVDAVVHTGTRSHTLVVPVSAVLRDDKNEPIVYVEREPGKFAQRSVTTAGQQDGLIAVTSGLQEGETIVSDGSLFLQFAATIK
ncbi:MAG TPA: efflux RND transporter periplasmic adaptor subunit [Candidatus Sulfopaludibacter sp.]|jgi:cobalt-zinc-cadmium efflux system membrane fusion protein|nr:efflux RND transporter periplasmic adaptor subunit [Candidatus Sulfopaludibacter sp.]